MDFLGLELRFFFNLSSCFALFLALACSVAEAPLSLLSLMLLLLF